MKKHYFLGLAARRKGALKQLFTHGSRKDAEKLADYLSKHYGGEAVLAKNGRSALCLALKENLNRGDGVIVNAFTCYAVIEAIKAAGMHPIYADISKEDLNFTPSTLARLKAGPDAPAFPQIRWFGGPPAGASPAHLVRAIIVQNTLGNPVNMAEIEKFAKKYDIKIIEDLAHCTGIRYPDGREAGTVGVATVLSFGKEKSIDTTSGGAVIFRGGKTKRDVGGLAPTVQPKLSDYLRERWYPTFAAWARGLTRVHLGGLLMRLLVKIRFVEKSADNRLDLKRRMPNFEAKLALEQLGKLKKSGEPPLREFYLVENRGEVLEKLKKAGYYFDGFWYEKPVSPERYYKKVHFDEDKCPVSTEVASKIINFPTYYSKKDLEPARKIIKEYLSAK